MSAAPQKKRSMRSTRYVALSNVLLLLCPTCVITSRHAKRGDLVQLCHTCSCEITFLIGVDHAG